MRKTETAACKGIVRNTKSMQERGALTIGKAGKRTVQTCWNESWTGKT